MFRARDLPAPPLFGAPEAFASWRDAQADAVMQTLGTSKRFVGLQAPTGIGKSMIAVMLHLMTGLRVCILTAQRPLQDLYMRDWGSVLFDMRGQRNYECEAVKPGGPLSRYYRGAPITVDHAPCHAGVWCPLRHRGGCGYYDDQKIAASWPAVVTNYDYWITGGPSLGHFDILVMDEADEADGRVRASLHIGLQHSVLHRWLGIAPLDPGAPTDEWRDWGSVARKRCSEVVAEFTDELMRDEEAIDKQSVAELRRLREMEETLARIQQLEGEWLVAASRRGGGTDFDPIWPAPYCEEMLYRGIGQIVLMSATLVPKDLEILGVPRAECLFLTYDSPFPLSHRPVWILDMPDALRVRVDNRLRDYSWLVTMMDTAIGARLDRKQMIHSVSYKLTREILRLSKHRDLMITHEDADSKPDALERFRKAVPGGPDSILVTPSTMVGESFPGDECRVVHFPKLPFVDMRDEIMRRREAEDPEYGGHLLVKALAQGSGRHNRFVGDWGETIIYDDHARWAFPKFRRHAPRAFTRAVKWTNCLPLPLTIN